MSSRAVSGASDAVPVFRAVSESTTIEMPQLTVANNHQLITIAPTPPTSPKAKQKEMADKIPLPKAPQVSHCGVVDWLRYFVIGGGAVTGAYCEGTDQPPALGPIFFVLSLAVLVQHIYDKSCGETAKVVAESEKLIAEKNAEIVKQNAEVDRLQQVHTNLTQDNAKFQKENTTLQQTEQKTREDVTVVGASADQYKQENTRLQSELAALKQELVGAKAVIEKERAAVGETKSETAAVNSATQNVDTVLTQVRAEKELLAKQVQEEKRASVQFAEDAAKSTAALQVAGQRIQALEQQIEAKERQLEDQTAAFAKERAALTKDVSDLGKIEPAIRQDVEGFAQSADKLAADEAGLEKVRGEIHSGVEDVKVQLDRRDHQIAASAAADSSLSSALKDFMAVANAGKPPNNT